MKSNLKYLVLVVLMGGLILSACGGGAPQALDGGGGAAVGEPDFYEAAATEAAAMEEAFAPQIGVEAAKAQPVSAEAASDSAVDGAPVDIANNSAGRMIIKNADIKLLVEDTDIAIDRATQAIADAGGYIVSSRVWYQPYYDGKNYKYATITIGIPVTQFERTLSKLRGLSVQVLDETASGEDVSDQFVDLQSQVVNLEATRDRIKSFLDEAKTVDEALRINAELANVEAQIEQIKGQMNYLKDRSAYSTITINLEPKLPEIATPTPVPTATPLAWKPGETFEDASKSLTSAYQGIVNFLIWVFVFLLPIFAPPILIIWGLWKWLARKLK